MNQESFHLNTICKGHMNLYKFNNTERLGIVPEYCISASVVAMTEEKARKLLSDRYEDERFLDDKISKLEEVYELHKEFILDWESDS